MTKFIFEGPLSDITYENSGMAIVSQIDLGPDEPESGLFVRVHSWDEDKIHTDINTLLNKTIRVTIEVI